MSRPTRNHLTLRAADLRALQNVTAALLAPFEFPNADMWRSRVNALYRELLGADYAGFLLPAEAGLQHLYSDELPGSAAADYPDWLRPYDQRYGLVRRQLRLRVWSRRALYGRHYEAMLRSPYYLDYIVPLRAFDTIGLTTRVGPQRLVAGVMFHHDHPTRRRFRRRERDLLRLLYPAFRAGVDSFLRLHSARHGFARLLDELEEPLLLATTDGRVLHVSRALEVLLGASPRPAELLAAMQNAAATLGASVRGIDAAGMSARAEVPLDGAGAGRRLARACMAPLDICATPAVIVTLPRLEERLPSPGELQGHHGLTPQEARVALLLAERRRNEEIAETLAISVHTARRHTESVLRKLGVHSRVDVRNALLRIR